MAIQPIKKDYSMDTTQELITIQELSERLKLHVVRDANDPSVADSE